MHFAPSINPGRKSVNDKAGQEAVGFGISNGEANLRNAKGLRVAAASRSSAKVI